MFPLCSSPCPSYQIMSTALRKKINLLQKQKSQTTAWQNHPLSRALKLSHLRACKGKVHRTLRRNSHRTPQRTIHTNSCRLMETVLKFTFDCFKENSLSRNEPSFFQWAWLKSWLLGKSNFKLVRTTIFCLLRSSLRIFLGIRTCDISPFVSLARARVWLLFSGLFCFLRFGSFVSLTGSYIEGEKRIAGGGCKFWPGAQLTPYFS